MLNQDDSNKSFGYPIPVSREHTGNNTINKITMDIYMKFLWPQQ